MLVLCMYVLAENGEILFFFLFPQQWFDSAQLMTSYKVKVKKEKVTGDA